MKEKYIINGEYKKNGFFINFHKKKKKKCRKKNIKFIFIGE